MNTVAWPIGHIQEFSVAMSKENDIVNAICRNNDIFTNKRRFFGHSEEFFLYMENRHRILMRKYDCFWGIL